METRNKVLRHTGDLTSVATAARNFDNNGHPAPVRSNVADDWEPTSELLEKDMHEGNLGKELADMHTAKGHHDDAVAVLEGLLAKNPSDFILRIKLAQSYTLKKDHAMAISKWKDLLEDQPWNAAFRRILAHEYKLHNDVALELSGWKDLAEKNPSGQNQESLLAVYEAQTEALASAGLKKPSSGSSSRLKIRSPFTLKTNSLFDILYKSAEALYGHLDKLENSGFAIGFDILPEVSEMILAEVSSVAVFTGMLMGETKVLMSRQSGNVVGTI